jgi:hypothetical protein
MATPSTSEAIGVSNINTEVGRAAGTADTTLSFLNDYLKPSGTTALNTGGTVSTPSPERPVSPNMNTFRGGLTYYQKNNAGNCNNSNNGATLNCNARATGQCSTATNTKLGTTPVNCSATQNCTALANCVNCDRQKWLQTGNCQGTTPVYNCTANQNCFNINCNCSKIICTKLFDLGLMKKNIFVADQAFGEQLKKTHPDIYNGYRAWAEIVVDWMDGKGPKMMPWMSDEDFSVAAKKWSITWAYDIATPWAEEMAYMMGEKETGSLTGKMMFAFGTPICKVIGVWQRWFGPSKKEPGFLKGAGLVVIFVMFKLVAELGRLIERVIPNKKVV